MKKILIGVLVLALAFSMAACGGGGNGESGNDDGGGIISRVDKMLSAQGRSYDELITGEIGDTLTCSFFEFKITNVEAAEELEGNLPNKEGGKFIVADVEVKNIYVNEDGEGEAIPVGNYDFNIIWDTEEETTDEDHWAFPAFMDGMYPDDVMLEAGDTLSGKLVFELPGEINDFGISYAEVYDDEFVGNTYVVECAL